MKGVVYVQFSEFVEELWGLDFWSQVLDDVDPESGGIYTTVATYDDQELFDLIGNICEKKGLSGEEAQVAFGKWLFTKLYKMAPPGAHEFKDAFEFLHGVQNVIHVEVKKLNPDAILPEFVFLKETETELHIHYISPRNMPFFCEGLILGLGEFTGETLTVKHLECTLYGDQRCVLQVNKV